MSSPIPIAFRPTSPSSASDASSYTSTSSSSSTCHALIYTREELLSLASSPLAQGSPPPALRAFPQLMRRKHRNADGGARRSNRKSPRSPIPDAGGASSFRDSVPALRATASGNRKAKPQEQRKRSIGDTKMWWRAGPAKGRLSDGESSSSEVTSN